MSIHELNIAPPDQVPDEALGHVRRWAAQRPLEIALRHRRRGIWKAWRWIDVLREVERKAAALRQQGFGAGSRLAVSGAYEPTLLLLALAAKQLGGHTQSISRYSQGEALRRQVLAGRADFAFVQRREQAAAWLAIATDDSRPLTLFCAQPIAATQGRWRTVPLSALIEGQPSTDSQGWRQAYREPASWCDEGSEWADGLRVLLQHWLEGGQGLAFPESSESAARDRREIAPVTLLLSPPRLQRLAAEIEARLAPAGSWRRRLCDWTQRAPGRGVRRWIKARVRRLLGFQRLQRIVQGAAPSTTPATAPIWIREYLEHAA
ncbi:AMP-binding protein [Phytopseudomonas dryadis]|uniref:AMP-binding enzyme n=1 Tax=Phytopseudomonas dryadis TaxID=2487520 RepID=A0ABY1Z5D6_9GAMM|nr:MULTISPECIES: AMP-binding protein [Pseudomonas]TBV01802.1 hypothetical protein DNK34_20330 [Pseudomonas dryadis]TBV14422.1 hypothetical protein DNK41_20270 [Pseudomonas sp. FRB 230]